MNIDFHFILTFSCKLYNPNKYCLSEFYHCLHGKLFQTLINNQKYPFLLGTIRTLCLLGTRMLRFIVLNLYEYSSPIKQVTCENRGFSNGASITKNSGTQAIVDLFRGLVPNNYFH